MPQKSSKLIIQSIKKSQAAKPSWSIYLMIALILALVALSIVYIVHITKTSKKEMFVEQDQYQIILIYSENCGHCHTFKQNVFDSFDPSKYFVGKQVVAIQYESKSENAQKYNKLIDGVPSVFVEKNGEIIGKIVGSRTLDVFVTDLKAFI